MARRPPHIHKDLPVDGYSSIPYIRPSGCNFTSGSGFPERSTAAQGTRLGEGHALTADVGGGDNHGAHYRDCAAHA